MSITLGFKLAATAAGLSTAAIAAMLSLFGPARAPFETVLVTLTSGKTIETGRDEITHALWMECVTANACKHIPASTPPAGMYPVSDINAQDITQFIGWLKQSDYGSWRLPTREEAAEFTASLPRDDAKKLFDDPRMEWAADYLSRKTYTRPVKSSGTFGTLANGLRDLGGNVWEWTSTCTAKDTGGYMCPAYFVYGEHEAEIPTFLRDAVSGGCAAGVPPTNLGFRLVRDR